MALSIKDPETDRLARDLAKATGESLTDAINGALRDKLRIVCGDQRTEEQFIADAMKTITRRSISSKAHHESTCGNAWKSWRYTSHYHSN